MDKLFKYFLRGFIALIPVFIFYHIIKSLSVLTKDVFTGINIFFSFGISFLVIIFLGYMITRGFGGVFKNMILKRSKGSGPLSFFFRSILGFKDISEKAKSAFKNPVYFEVSDGIYKLGFITKNDVEFLSREDGPKELVGKVAVYAPEPISFVGELLFVDKKMIKLIDEKEKNNIPVFLYTAGIIDKMK